MTRKDSGIGDAARKAIEIRGLGPDRSYLSFKGILPITMREGSKGLILPDVHIPAHNRRLVYGGVMQFAYDFQPDTVIAIGDWADIFALSRHPKGLAVRPVSAQDELDESRRVWDDVMDASGAEHGFIICGNHEDRIYRFLQEMAPQMGSLVNARNREPIGNFHEMMGFERDDNVTVIYGVEMRGGFEGGLVINGDFNLHHGIIVRPNPGASNLADSDRWQWSVGHGHTHRKGMTAREAGKRVLRSYEFGHLVNPNHAYLAYAKKDFANWSPGLATFHVHNGKVHVQPLPIFPINGKLSFKWDGQTYSESDR